MTKKVFSCILIGLGDIGLNYDLHRDQSKYIQTHSRAFFLNSGFDLQGGVDINSDACDTFTKKYNVKSFNMIEEALNEIKPDLVILAVPTSFQFLAIKEVLSCFVPKSILCEKPMGENLQDGKKIVSICKEKDVSLYVNYIRRCLPESMEIKRQIDEGIINTPIKSVVWYSKGISHNGAHFINLMEYWFGKCLDVKVINKGREFEGFGLEPLVHMKFENSEVIMISAWEEHFSHYTIEIVSSTGRLYWGNNGLEWQNAIKSKNFTGYSYLSDESEEIHSGGEKYQMHVADELYLAMTGNHSSISSGEQALQTLQTIDLMLPKD
ncbi:Gfo/Idh/MocA family oxidoreductase [Candidatus Thioglobus sp.]|nr:Gfo/Idh/MocA family oxidoreductase [Candidatus Thioglobus sp.]